MKPHRVITHGSRHRAAQLQRRFRKTRNAVVGAAAHALEPDSDLEWNDYWQTYRWKEYGVEGDENGYPRWHSSKLAALLGGLPEGERLHHLVDSNVWHRLLRKAPPDAEPQPAPDEVWQPLPSDELIDTLCARCQEICDTTEWETIVQVPLEDIAVLRKFWLTSMDQFTSQGWSRNVLTLNLQMLLLLEPFWVRPAVTWRCPEVCDSVAFGSLVEHLFVLYPPPPSLISGVDWLTGEKPCWKWLLWVVVFGSGASMHRASRKLGWWVNSGFLLALHSVPAHLDCGAACVWAEVHRKGGSPSLAEALIGHRVFCIDPTELHLPDNYGRGPERWNRTCSTYFWLVDERKRAVAFRPFWQATLEWLVRHESDMPAARLNSVLDWANHAFSEDRHFNWKGRTPAATLRAADEYIEGLNSHQGPLRSWSAHGWDWQWTDDISAVWTLRELTNSAELFNEGQALRHCVGSYGYRCMSGSSAIFSLRCNDVRVLTIEIELKSKMIRQAYGRCNRRALASEMEVVFRWKAEVLDPHVTVF